MLTFIAVIHILLAISMVALVLLQDSKGGAMGLSGGGGSNQIMSSTNAANFLVKATRIIAVLFAVTSIGLTWASSHRTASVTDKFTPPAQATPAVAPVKENQKEAQGTEATQTPESISTPPATTPEKK